MIPRPLVPPGLRPSLGRAARVTFLAAVAITPAGLPSLAFADDAADAMNLFIRGRELRAQGDCAHAVALFRKAYAVYPAGLGSLRNFAECEEAMSHFAAARGAWLELGRALLTRNDPKYEGWTADAESAAARLQPKVATVQIDLDVVDLRGRARPSDSVQVILDSEPLPSTLLGTALERDAGTHVVWVKTAWRSELEEHRIDVSAGEAKRVSLRVVVPESNPTIGTPTSGAAPAPAPDPLHHPGALRTTAWVAGGIGAAALIGAGISLVVRQGALDDLNNLCGGDTTPCNRNLSSPERDRAQGLHDRGVVATTLVNVFVPIGVAGLAGGVALFFAGTPRQPLRMALTLSPFGASAVGSF